MIDGEDEKTKDLRKDKWRHLERKKIKQTKDWGEDTFWGWKKWLNDIDETKDLQDLQVLVSEDIHWEKKRLLQRKDCGEWGHTLGMKEIVRKWWLRTFFKRKTKDYQRKKIWWVRTSIGRKKDKEKIVVSEDTLFGW